MFIIRLKEGTARWEHFGLLDPKLCMIFFDAVFFLQRHNIQELTITSMIRPKENDSGIHADARAIDLRADFSQDIGMDMVSYINNKYPYDQMRAGLKTVLFHTTSDYNDPGAHYHFQVRGVRNLKG